MEIFNWLSDVTRHAAVSRRRKSLRRVGSGVDYSDPEYLGQASRVSEKLHPPRMRLKVLSVIERTATAKSFRLGRIDGHIPPFRPGQYLSLSLKIGGITTNRPYSIASRPGLDYLEVTIRRKPGGFVSGYMLDNLHQGDEVQSSGPQGHFHHNQISDGEDLVFLAGGSGVTPFMSMISDATRRMRPWRIHLIHGSRRADDIIYHGQFGKIADETPGFKYSVVLSEPEPGHTGHSGLLDTQMLAELIPHPEGKTFFISGPPAMHLLVGDSLLELGAPPHRIRRELFGLPDDITAQPGWPQGLAGDTAYKVRVEGVGSFSARAGEPLLASLERAGMSHPASCRSGQCGACRLKVLEGEVFSPASARPRESDQATGYVHGCASYPLSDLVIRL